MLTKNRENEKKPKVTGWHGLTTALNYITSFGKGIEWRCKKDNLLLFKVSMSCYAFRHISQDYFFLFVVNYLASGC